MPPSPPNKRRKTRSSVSALDLPENHAIYLEWALERGVEIHGVKPAVLPGRGVGLLVTKKIPKDSRLVFVPEKAMIKPEISLLRENKLLKASSQAQLAAYLTLEGKDKSATYLQSKSVWPTPEDFQACMLAWSTREERGGLLRKLAPPSVQKPLDRLQSDLERDIASVEHLRASEDETFDETFLYHWILVNTRSFHWKPIGVNQGAMVMCPFLDYMNHCPNGNGCQVTMSTEGYELRSDRDYEPGEEILATYGAHPNDKLLVHYGFVLPAPYLDDDEIRLDHVILPHFNQAQQNMLQDVGYLGGYALLSSNELCFKTQVAVRSVLLTANEWEHFMGSGEDLAEDKEGEVRGWLKPFFEEYIHEAKEAIKTLKMHQEGQTGALASKLGLLQARWEQIQHGLEEFLA